MIKINNQKCLTIGLLFITVAVNLMLVNVAKATQNNSLYLRAEQLEQRRTLRGVQKQDEQTAKGNAVVIDGKSDVMLKRNITPVIQANWFAVEEPTPKDYRVHDLVTILVNEISKHSISAATDTKRDSSMDYSLSDWVRITGGALQPDALKRGAPKISGAVQRDFKGESDNEREDTLTARIQAEVIDVLPNGNLVLEAVHHVKIDNEETIITLTGVCRSKDIGLDNTIISSKVANLEVNKTHKGMSRDATKRSVLQKVLDFLNPF